MQRRARRRRRKEAKRVLLGAAHTQRNARQTENTRPELKGLQLQAILCPSVILPNPQILTIWSQAGKEGTAGSGG